jgi:hypothetical protein
MPLLALGDVIAHATDMQSHRIPAVVGGKPRPSVIPANPTPSAPAGRAHWRGWLPKVTAPARRSELRPSGLESSRGDCPRHRMMPPCPRPANVSFCHVPAPRKILGGVSPIRAGTRRADLLFRRTRSIGCACNVSIFFHVRNRTGTRVRLRRF